MFRMTFLPAYILMLLLLVPACGSDDDEDAMGTADEGKPPAEMVGTWIYQSVTVDGTAASLATVLDWVANAVEARITVQANSAYFYEEVNAAGGQLWSESGFVFVNDAGEIDINMQQNSDGSVNEMSTFDFNLSGSTLTLQEVDQGMTIVFTLTM